MKRLLLLLALLALILVGCSTSTGLLAQSTTAQTELPVTYFQITDQTVLVRADESNEALDAMRLLQDAIEQIYGIKPPLRTDFLMDGESPAPSEILVGITNREAAKPLYDSLTAMDYGYQIISDGTLAIAGGNRSSTIEAVNAFLSAELGYSGEGSGIAKESLASGPIHLTKYDYPVDEMTLSGTALAEYTITYDSAKGFKDAAQILHDQLAMLTGVSLPICKASSTPETPHVIHLKSDEAVRAYYYSYTAADGDFTISCRGDHAEVAAADFVLSHADQVQNGKLDIPAPEKKATGYAFNTLETYRLSYQSTTDEIQVCPGVTRYTRHYVDQSGNPTKVYIIECAPGSVKPVLGTKNAELDITGTQQVLDQLAAEVDKTGADICAAVNGCLFVWNNGAIEPFGTCIKDGTIVTDLQREVYAIFAVMKDGSYFFGYPSADNVDIKQIDQCVSGAYMLIDDGILTDMGLSWPDLSFAHTRHPRTAIGAKADGTLYFVVVDGRQSGHSIGVTLPDLAMIFDELGCNNAVNIDGGGSSISYTKDYKTGKYVLWNKPSDGSPRAVITSVLITRNPDYKE